MSTALTDPIAVAGRTAPSRVLFGPHETNLGRGRALSDRHVAYYARRAAGGAGVVVTETASVHDSDWPYERAPLAAECADGWADVVRACRPHGTLVLAGIGHTGAQGSSAYSQQALWAPSRVADATSRELPMEMERPEIDALLDGFGAAVTTAVHSGCHGVEVDAGPGALLRQFHSGLTNLRTDEFGADRLALTRMVLERVRAALGHDRVLALRLSCDELAPWAGVTPEMAAAQAVDLADLVDLLVVTRGGPYSGSSYRPDGHTPPMFNLDLARTVRTALAEAGAATRLVLQGSVVDPGPAAQPIVDGVCDMVEMTRALVADAELPTKVRAGTPERVRPCVLCNQACRVRDARNPIVSCIADPRSGHETVDPDPEVSARSAAQRRVLVVGAGPGGLEASRLLRGRGHEVRLVDRSTQAGGAAVLAAALPGRERMGLLVEWWRAECDRLGVQLELGHAEDAKSLKLARRAGTTVLLATGGRPAPGAYEVGEGAVVLRDDEVLAMLARGDGDALPAGPVVVLDLVGGPTGLGVAERLATLGRSVAVVTGDQIVGTMLAMTGDLADGNTRLLRAGVTRHTSRVVREVHAGWAVTEDRFTGTREDVACGVLVHCGYRVPEDDVHRPGNGATRLGDCVAPRTVLEAVLEARRAADDLDVQPAPSLGRRVTHPIGALVGAP
jgi:2,4-dienoyl-CoA reductase (NADPH2)